jgi:hypothetical protein
LRNNAVGADGAQALALILSCNPKLKKLTLYWNNIRNKGLRAICENLPAPPLPPDYRVVPFRCRPASPPPRILAVIPAQHAALRAAPPPAPRTRCSLQTTRGRHCPARGAGQDLRNNGFDPADPTAGADAGAPPEEDQWEALEEKLKKAKLKYESSYSEDELQFLGWPLG